jgi:hypothetical protein
MDNQVTLPSPAIILIGGTGRSGTNITKALLSRHPAVASLPFEYRFIIDPDGIVDFYRSFTGCWSPYMADRRLKRLETLLLTLAEQPTFDRIIGNLIRKLNPNGKLLTPRTYHRWHLDAHLPNFKQHVQALIAELRDFSFPAYWVGSESYVWRPRIHHAGPKAPSDLAPILGGFINRVIHEYLTQAQKSFFVEDNTWNILFARELLDLIPQARILHIYRDPRDVVASFTHQRWCPTDVEQAARWYRDLMSHWFTVRADLPQGSYYEFNLDRLVMETEPVVKEICEFTGVSFHPAMLQIDLSKSNRGRWEQDFTPAEQSIVQHILGDLIEELG